MPRVIIRNPKKIDDIVFIPPESKDVRKITGDLFKFIESNIGKIDSIILAGIFHRQCVIIHPFIDGNGRTTRYRTWHLLYKGFIKRPLLAVLCRCSRICIRSALS
jgi:Fic family protein